MPLGGGGEPNAMTLGGVREAAAEARPIFERVMRRIADSARLDPDERVLFEGKPLPIEHGSDIFYTRLMIAPPKGEKRCVEKIETEYGGKACLLVDVVRCSVVVDAEEQLISVAKPLFNGYRDALYSVRVQIAPGVWHVCEMQLHLAAVIAHKEHTHVYYEFFRSHFAGNMSAADGVDVARMNLVRDMLAKMGEFELALVVARG